MKLKEKDLLPTDGEWEYDNIGAGWYSELNKKLHNSLGPAFLANDYKEWWINNNLHRLDGPAVERLDGAKQWWVNGNCVSEQDFPSIVISFLLGVDKKQQNLLNVKLNNEV